MITTVQNLIDRLEEFDPDAEVRLAIQPSYPFEHEIGNLVETILFDEHDAVPAWGVVVRWKDGTDEEFVEAEENTYGNAAYLLADIQRRFAADDNFVGAYIAGFRDGEILTYEDMIRLEGEADRVVYIGEARQLGYLPGHVKSELDW